MLTIYANDELFKTISLYSNQKSVIVNKLKEFIAHKIKYPVNGYVPKQIPGYGSSDRKFIPGGHFDQAVNGIAHAHLTHNISIVYLIEGDKLHLYGVYTHDAIGTGNPPNIPRQKSAAARWSNMSFDAPLDTRLLDEPAPAAEPAIVKPDKPVKPKVDYTPKPKTQPAAKPAEDATAALAKKVDAFWPQRALFDKLSRAESKAEAVNIISQEAQYISAIKQRGQKIYPNVMDYFKGLGELYDRYSR
jgi:hypothetical protein